MIINLNWKKMKSPAYSGIFFVIRLVFFSNSNLKNLSITKVNLLKNYFFENGHS